MPAWEGNSPYNLYFSTSCKPLHFNWTEPDSWNPNHRPSGSRLGNDVSPKFLHSKPAKRLSTSAVFQADGDRRAQQANEWRVHQVRVLRCREASANQTSVWAKNSAKPQFVACRSQRSFLVSFLPPPQHYKAALQYFQQLGSNAGFTWQRDMEIEAPGSSVYHRQRQQQTAKEVWNLERKLQIDEPNSGGRQACQVRVIVWRWSVHTSHNHIPACWLQLTTLFQSREALICPLTCAEKEVPSLVKLRNSLTLLE